MLKTEQQMCREWRPKHGVMFTMLIMIVIAILTALSVSLSVHAYAQQMTVKPDSDFDFRGLLTMLLPAIWASVGPLVLSAITKVVNTTMHAYVPRPAQVIVSGIIGAVGAGLVDGGVSAAATAVSGGASQIYAATKPSTLRTTAPPQPTPGN